MALEQSMKRYGRSYARLIAFPGFRLGLPLFFVLSMAVAGFGWGMAEVLWLGKIMTFWTFMKVVIILALVLALVWLGNREERRLRREVEEQNRQLRQRIQEIKALNELFQAYLNEHFSGVRSLPGG